jgi:hypothetical protein
MGNIGVRAQTTTRPTLHLLTRGVPKVMILNAISSAIKEMTTVSMAWNQWKNTEPANKTRHTHSLKQKN